MKTVTLNVISLATAVQFLDVDYSEIVRLIASGGLTVSSQNGELVLDEEEFELLEQRVKHLGLSKGNENITVYELQDFCLSKGYVSDEKTFNRYLQNGLFSNFKVVRPFNNAVSYKHEILKSIVQTEKTGGIITLKHGGYTRSAIIKELGISEQRFVDLTVMLSIKPKMFDSNPIYSLDNFLSIRILNEKLEGEKVVRQTESKGKIIEYNGLDYIVKEDVREYLGCKHSTVTYLNNLGVIKYKEVASKQGVLTLVLQSSLDEIKDYLNKGYQPAIISLLLSGFLTVEELNNYLLDNQLVVEGGETAGSLKVLLDKHCHPDMAVQGVKIYKKTTVEDFIRKYVRGTHTVANLSPDFISTHKLGELVGKASKNIKSYALKYLDMENDIVRTSIGVCIRLSSYLDLQTNKEVEDVILKEEDVYKEKLNVAL